MAQEENREISHIEDFIDACNASGEYDVLCNSSFKQPIARYMFSAPASQHAVEKQETVEGDVCPDLSGACYNSVGSTDSEITIVRVKRENLNAKAPQPNTWDHMHDSAIAGDGTHLGESPSLVNLVTFVVPQEATEKADQREYMVALSSWEPTSSMSKGAATAVASTDNSCLSMSNETMRSNKSTTSARVLLRKIAFWRSKTLKREKK